MFGRITPTKSPSFSMTTFNASLTNLKAVLPQFTRLQLLRQQTNTGTATSLTAETRWSARTRLRALSRFVTSA